MCGIVGLWNLDGAPIDEPMLSSFTDSLAHRGPDGRGTFVDSSAGLGLGHRRLAILDLSPAGHQPMAFGDSRYQIVHNGEIYNFLELRNELEALGHRFATESDTEVILASYAEWGKSCLLRFNGMWAFAIWDSVENVLFLSRDRFGIKPLHYLYDGRHFAFASEMKAFLNLAWFRPTFDSSTVSTAILNMSSIEGGEDCLLVGLKRLRGGHSLTMRQNGPPKPERWWNTLEHLERPPSSYPQQVERFRELFFDACNIRMRSDVPLATALSGGLDSSSVLSAMARLRSQTSPGARQATDWQRAFIATFPGTYQDEREYADEAVRHTGAEPVYKEIDPSEVIDHIDEVLFQFEEIYDVPAALWLLYRELRSQGVTVSMDGHGGDELLAGYHWHPLMAMRDALDPLPRPLRLLELRSTLRQMYPEDVNVHVPGLRTMVGMRLQDRPLAYTVARLIAGLIGKSRPPDNERRWPEDYLHVRASAEGLDHSDEDRSALSQLGHLNRRLYSDFHVTVLPTILRNFDRLSMAHGVEIRAPFMDWRLVCYSVGLPATSKIGGGFTKRVLRDAMRGDLPEGIAARTTKIGFVSPLVDWFKGPMKDFVLDSVNSQAFLQSEIWDGPSVRDVVERSCANGDYDTASQSWKFIQAMRLMQLFQSKASA